MATKDDISFTNGRHQSFADDISYTNNENRFSNLSLNRSHKSQVLSPVQSFSKSNSDKNSATVKLPHTTVSDNYEGKLKTWNKSLGLCTLKSSEESKTEATKRWGKKGGSSDASNSTLSLHISAYENSINAVSSDLFGDKNVELKRRESDLKNQLFPVSIIQNPFEFPRQQKEDKIIDPETKKFRASQILINPNEAPSSKKERSLSAIPEHSPALKSNVAVQSTPVHVQGREQQKPPIKDGVSAENAPEASRKIMASSDDSAYGKSHSSNDTSGDANSTTSGNLNDLRSSKNITNPFDSHLFDSFQHTTFSPNTVLKTPATSKTRINTSFQWSIEQRSRILPAMIDESFIHESPDNPEYEQQVQRTLDKFWNSNQLIAPSPDVLGRMQRPLNFTPSPIVPFSRRNSRLFDSSSSPTSRASISTSTKETQTELSIPMDFDLEELLSKHLPQKQHASTPKKMKKFSSFIDKSTTNRDSLPSDADLDSLEDDGINLSIAIEESTRSRGDLGSTSFITEHTTNCAFDLSKISPIKHEMVSPHTRLSPIKEDN